RSDRHIFAGLPCEGQVAIGREIRLHHCVVYDFLHLQNGYRHRGTLWPRSWYDFTSIVYTSGVGRSVFLDYSAGEVKMSEETSNPSYGDYILRTGRGIIGEYELVFGAFFYQRFKGRFRVVDIGPGRCWFP